MNKFGKLGWVLLVAVLTMAAFEVGDNVLRVGDGTNSDKSIEANNGDVNRPSLKYSATSNAWQVSNNGTDFGPIATTSSALGINYITNPDFELNLDGWITYDDGAVADPVSGVGGAPSVLVLSQTTTAGEVLRGGASGKSAKAASDGQGEGISTLLNIEPADVGQALELRAVYSTSTDYASGDIGAYLNCDIDGTPAFVTLVIEGGGDNLVPTTAGGKSPITFDFTAPATEAELDCRLIFHTKTVNALAYDFIIDDVAVGPPIGSSTPLATEFVAGIVSIVAQVFGGDKTFTGDLVVFPGNGIVNPEIIEANVTGPTIISSTAADLWEQSGTLSEIVLTNGTWLIDWAAFCRQTSTGICNIGVGIANGSSTFSGSQSALFGTVNPIQATINNSFVQLVTAGPITIELYLRCSTAVAGDCEMVGDNVSGALANPDNSTYLRATRLKNP